MKTVIISVLSAMLTGAAFYVIGAFQTEVLVPPSAVLAFDSKDCPKGWDNLPVAEGKFIIGANEKFIVGTSGGKSSIELGPEHLAPHQHNAVKADSFSKTSGNNNYAQPLTSSFNGRIVPTGETGAGKPIDILPPWYALKYCRKN